MLWRIDNSHVKVPENTGSPFSDDKNICLAPKFKKKNFFVPAAMRIPNLTYFKYI
jgi:hypothetical protein